MTLLSSASLCYESKFHESLEKLEGYKDEQVANLASCQPVLNSWSTVKLEVDTAIRGSSQSGMDEVGRVFPWIFWLPTYESIAAPEFMAAAAAILAF